MDVLPDEEDTDESSVAWENEIPQVNRKLEMQPSSSCSLARPRNEAMCSQPVEKTHTHAERTVRKVSVASQMRKRKVEVRVKNHSKEELRQLYQEILNEKNKTSRNFWGAMQWPCTQTGAKRACDLSILQSSLPEATVRNLMKSNRIFKETKSDMMEIRVQAHCDEKLALVVWSDAAWANRKDFHHRSGRSKKKARLSSSEKMQAPADAKHEIYFKRPQLAKFLRSPVITDKADEMVQRVEGDVVIDAKSIYDSMYGESEPLAMEKTNSH